MEKFLFWSSLFSPFLNFLGPPFKNPPYATASSLVSSTPPLSVTFCSLNQAKATRQCSKVYKVAPVDGKDSVRKLDKFVGIQKYGIWYDFNTIAYQIGRLVQNLGQINLKCLFRALDTIVSRKFGHRPISQKVRGNIAVGYCT